MKLETLLKHVAAMEDASEVCSLTEAAKKRRDAIHGAKVKAAKKGWRLLFPFSRHGKVHIHDGEGRYPVQHRLFQAGDVLAIHSVQPRAKRVWFYNAHGLLCCLTFEQVAVAGCMAFPDEMRAQVAYASGFAVQQ